MQNERDDSVITCEKCNTSCKGGRKFKTHINFHGEGSCKHCGKKIPYNSTTSHVTKCIGEKSFKCENCSAVFNTEGNLKVHVTSVQCSATIVTKPWKTQVIWTDTWLQFTVFKSSSCLQKCMRSHNACICKQPFCESSSCLLKCIRSNIGCICKNTFFVSPQVAFKSAFVVTLGAFVKKRFLGVLKLPSQVHL